MDLSVYLGYPGEPSLGPTAFMHRVSALPNPDATLSHHWQDATHITFGVATAGIRYKIFKVETSVFTGREPDENRFNFDKPRFDSYAFRLSANPNAYWSFQASYGWLKSPEPLKPDLNIAKPSFSVVNTTPLGNERYLATSAIWGANVTMGDHSHLTNSYVLESALLSRRSQLYGRYELVEKNVHELVLEQFFADEEQKFNIHALTLGFHYNLMKLANTNFALGGQFTGYLSPSDLNPFYGEMPLSAQVFLRIFPQQLRFAPMNRNEQQHH